METRENYLPGELWMSYGGRDGANGEPLSLVGGNLIVQNLLILAYEKPLTLSELSKAIGIPAAYIEPIIKKLVDGELMVQTDSGKVYTDFIITKPQKSLRSFKLNLEFAHKHFDVIWDILSGLSGRISKMYFVQDMSSEQKIKLDRYALLKALQDFEQFGTGKAELPKFPNRRDGGRWFAQATAIDAGYNMKEYNEASEYMIHGGHRTSEAFAAGGTRRVRLYEFDTTLWDSPHRYWAVPDGLYFKYIIPFLWCIYADIPLEKRIGFDFPNELISSMPRLEKVGLIGNTQNKPRVTIPVLKKAEYEALHAEIKFTTEEIKSAIVEAFAAFISSMKTPVPEHLKSVPELFRYIDASRYFVMAILREAYDRGLHLKGVNYACPPAVLVYED